MSIVFEPARATQTRFQFPEPNGSANETPFLPGNFCLQIIHYLIGSDYKETAFLLFVHTP